jgi:catechol 2,3-dioxygenase-like lactoylglutathione lyase family enzyme
MTPLEAPAARGDPTVPGIRRSDFLRRAAVAGATATGAGVLVASEAQAHGKRSYPAASPLDHRGLHNRVNRLDRIVTNVSDLERSKEFWEATTPLRATARTQSPQQPFRNLGIASGRFDGYLLQDQTGGNPFAVHLVEWKDPKPVGTPYRSPLHVGWYRLAIFVEDINFWYQKVLDAGGEPWSEPADFTSFIGAPGIPVFGFPDPDGITIEYVELAGNPVGRVNHIASSTADIDGTRPFYTDVLGLDFTMRSSSCPVPNTLGPDGGEAGYDVTWFRPRGDARVSIDHLTWAPPAAAFGTPYDVFGQPTHRGFHRLSIEVDDIDASYRSLVKDGLRRRGSKRGRRLSGPPEDWDFGPEFGGRRKVVVLTDPEGVGFELIQQAPYPTASNTPQPIGGVCPPPGSVAIPPQPDRQ